MKIKVINPDNTKSEIDTNKLDDYLSLQLEEQERIIEFHRKYGLYIWAFTLDCKNQGGSFYNLPDDSKSKLLFIENMNNKIQQLTKGEFILVPKKMLESI